MYRAGRPRRITSEALVHSASIAVIAILLLLQGACSATRLTEVWSEPPPQAPLRKLVVVGIDPSTAGRRVFENALAASLEEKGIEAFKSYEYLPPETEADRDSLGPLIKKHQIDGILASTMLRVEERQRYVDSGPAFYPFDGFGYYGMYRDYYPWAYRRVYSPGYVVQYREYYLETNLFDAKTGKLLFTATSETTDPGSVQALAESLAKELVEALQQRGFLLKGLLKNGVF